MSTIYDLLRSKKGRSYSEDQITKYSYLSKKPAIDKPSGALAGISRVHGDASPKVQDSVIDMLIEIGARYKLPYRDIAHILLICKIESGFNPDAAAGTTSAAGLGQYTVATVEEAAKENISKKRLGFTLDLSGDNIFDAERGAFGVVLSYMVAKERAIKFFHEKYENNLYLFHHQGWYFKPTDENMEKSDTKEVLKIINKSILPYLDPIEKLLKEKTDISFKLLTKDDMPYSNHPYLAIFPSGSINNMPFFVQGALKNGAEVIFGKTDDHGKTKAINTPGLSEVLFIVLANNYKELLDVSANAHVVGRNETLEQIAKENDTTVSDLRKINHIANGSQVKEGQKLLLHTGEYLWRRPPMELVSIYLKKALNIHGAASPAIVEHKRSHINLPNGNVAQQHAGEKNIVAIRGGATSDQVKSRKKEIDIPHKTIDKNIKKEVKKAPLEVGKAIKEGLLFPLPIHASADYHKGARRFKSNRGKRLHAGCDLYAPKGTEVRAMSDGKIVHCYPFYWETDAIEVDHGGFIVRYGEIAPRSKDERDELEGKEVKRGDALGQVGQLIQPNGKKYKDTMLHLEIYGTAQSPKVAALSNKSAPFQRRADLIDPTATIDKCVMS
jgi:murein DD-endopeptidase MepM/ murein hydrolase activator NlpD